MSLGMRELDVYVAGRRSGRLSSGDGRRLEFEYVDSHQDATAATPLSLSMPLTRKTHSPAIVTNFFEALLPEHGPARERLEMESGVPRTDTLGLLAYVGRDLPGAITLVDPGVTPPGDGGVTPLSDEELTSIVADLRRSAATGGIPDTEHGQWSLAGAQAKVALTHSGGRWAVPHGAVPTTHIVKPAVPGFDDFDIHEVVLLRAARHLGMNVADAWVQPLVDGTHAAVIVRYDRLAAAAGAPIMRVHQEDLGQALGYPTWQKYQKAGGPGIAEIAVLLRGLPVSARTSSIDRFFEALAFSYAIAGTDAHARNYSLLLTGSQATLAPLYDINSALPYTRPFGRRFDSHRKLHSSFVIGSTDAFTRITPQDWMAVGELLGIDGDEAVERVGSMVARTPEAIIRAGQEISASAGIPVGFDWAPALSAYHAALQV